MNGLKLDVMIVCGGMITNDLIRLSAHVRTVGPQLAGGAVAKTLQECK
jgi:hypothetical protein